MFKSPLLIVSVIMIAGCATPSALHDPNGYVSKEEATWNAWTNDMPPGPRSLHVVGEVTLSNGRYSAVIKPSKVGPGYHCNVEVIDEGGFGTTALKSEKVSLVHDSYEGHDQLVIVHFPDGTTLEVPIESAQ